MLQKRKWKSLQTTLPLTDGTFTVWVDNDAIHPSSSIRNISGNKTVLFRFIINFPLSNSTLQAHL